MEEKRPWDITERTFSFALETIHICNNLDGRSKVATVLGKQLLRSGTSIGANVEEAQAGQSHADFVSKYAIALKEARETIYWLRLLRASKECRDGTIEKIQSEAEEIAKIIGAIIVRTKKNGKTK